MLSPTNAEKLLGAGLAAFNGHGFNATSVQDIVSGAGVPKGSFYNHFESKEALGVAVLASYWELGASARAFLDDDLLAPLDRLDRHFAAFGCPAAGCLIGNFSAELAHIKAFRGLLAGVWHDWIAALAGCVERGQRDGTITTEQSAVELAGSALALFEGAMLLARVEQSPRPLEAARRSLRRLLKP